ncbi:Hypothetical protein D9617_3g021970 [Elsinoe fawcettii]|nr:Hypothetical protein D9617_3g021970 [Elsinoe fawcettii]
MLQRTEYVSYKQSTQQLVQWIVRVSNAIIRANQETTPLKVNKTGQVKPAELVTLARLIARHTKKVPASILSLFKHVIDARSAFNRAFEAMTQRSQDAAIEKSNRSHAHFIQILHDAFFALGGESWLTESTDTDEKVRKDSFVGNAYSPLDLGIDLGVHELHVSCEADNDLQDPKRQSKRPKRNPKRKSERNASTSPTADEQLNLMFPDEVTLDQYRIVHEDEERRTDYFMAVFSFFHDWVELRKDILWAWFAVAFHGDNAAVAGATSTWAVAFIKRAEQMIARDFPGEEDFSSMLFTLDYIYKISETNTTPHTASRISIVLPDQEAEFLDAKEALSMYAYYDLIDFITDFQQNRNGKPTKEMAKRLQLDKWDHNPPLQDMTDAARVLWRRAYTTNYLYELVNAFNIGLPVPTTAKSKSRRSAERPSLFGNHKGLFGLAAFVGPIAELATQKPSQTFRARILPSQVFQLQLIVDSFTASRGWVLDPFRGHLVRPVAEPYQAFQQIDIMLRGSPPNEYTFLSNISQLLAMYEKFNSSGPNVRYPSALIEMIRGFETEVVRDLGVSRIGSPGHVSTRFPSCENGLWQYSPYLVGVALANFCEVSQEVGMKTFDVIPESLQIMHIYNKLIKTGVLKEHLSLLQSVGNLLRMYLYSDAREPTGDFERAYLKRVAERTSHPNSRTLLHNLQNNDIRTSGNRLFQHKSQLIVHRDNNYDLDNIPDEDLDVNSLWASVFMIPRITVNGKIPEDRSVLLTNLERSGVDGDGLSEMVRKYRSYEHRHDSQIRAWNLDSETQQQLSGPRSIHDLGREDHGNHRYGNSTKDHLLIVRSEFHRDVCGNRPFSSIDYLIVAQKFLTIYFTIQNFIQDQYPELYSRIVAEREGGGHDLKEYIHRFVLATEDKRCLELVASAFQKHPESFATMMYWGAEKETPSMPEDTFKVVSEVNELVGNDPKYRHSGFGEFEHRRGKREKARNLAR